MRRALRPRFSRFGLPTSRWRCASAGRRRCRFSRWSHTFIVAPQRRRQASASRRCGLGGRSCPRLCAGRPGRFRRGWRAVAPIAIAVGGGAEIARKGCRSGRRTFAGRRRRVAGARREIGASLRSRRASLVRSADRARRRARTVWSPEFSAVRALSVSGRSGCRFGAGNAQKGKAAFSSEAHSGLREENASREECEAWR